MKKNKILIKPVNNYKCYGCKKVIKRDKKGVLNIGMFLQGVDGQADFYTCPKCFSAAWKRLLVL